MSASRVLRQFAWGGFLWCCVRSRQIGGGLFASCLQCMKVKRESEVAQLCPTLSDPMDCNLPGSSAHGIFPGKSTGVGCHCLHRLLQLVCIENHVNSQGKWFILHNNHRYSLVTFQLLSILKFMFHRKLVKQIGL